MVNKEQIGVCLEKDILGKVRYLKENNVIKSMSGFGRDAIEKTLLPYEEEFKKRQTKITDYKGIKHG